MNFPVSLDPSIHQWLNGSGLARIRAALGAGGGAVRAVGGAVRDALLGRAVDEVDLASNLPPDTMMDLLGAAGIKVVPTGIAHGTITAVADGKSFEITTLRRDVETFGRHARVEFTDDWQADAARRDFTINAIYAEADGRLHDYFGGREDLAAGRVRFIGDAKDRIEEDVLRILRFFRFTAWFARGAADAEGLAACRELAHRLPQLSVERVWREICKLLNAENPAPVWRLMVEQGIVKWFLPHAIDSARLEGLVAAEKTYETQSSPLARLAALLPEDEKMARDIAKSLKTSSREAEKLAVLAALPHRLRGKTDPVPFRRIMYAHGAESSREAALLLAVEDPALPLEPLLQAAAAWDQPVFPLHGADIVALGVAAGPPVGEMLRGVEEWWAARDFHPTRDQCLAEAKARLQS